MGSYLSILPCTVCLDRENHNTIPIRVKKSDLDSRTAVIVILNGALAVIMTLVSVIIALK